METRHFTVIDSDTQRTQVIESNATTVAELKADLVANGFSVTNKTIQEGLSRVEFKSDDAILPHDVPFHGTTTNNLVFRLTKAAKHIDSGMTRKEAYAFIADHQLSQAVKDAFGRNFTQVSTAQLEEFFQQYNATETVGVPETLVGAESKGTVPSVEVEKIKNITNSILNILDLIQWISDELYDCDVFGSEASEYVDDKIVNIRKAFSTLVQTKPGIYTDDEISEMFADM